MKDDADRIVERTERRLARPEAPQGAMTTRRRASDRATMAGVTDEASRILDAALQLTDSERAEIAAILTDSIGDGSSPEEVQASWLAEAKRRLAAYERGETTAVDFDEMMERLRARVRRTRASTG
jgi:putative addiction module component (TIGR02574 family)